MVVKIINKWLAKKDRYEIGMNILGRMFMKDTRSNQNLINSGIKIKKGVVYNKFINPKTKEVKYIERHC